MDGRIGRVQAFMGSVLNVNPILGIKNGEALPYTRVRSHHKAVELLRQFALSFKNVKAIAVEYGTNVDEANLFAEKIKSLYTGVPVYLSHMSPVIGTHTGPGVLSVTIMES
jgi:DegV family protein with EDD domain